MRLFLLPLLSIALATPALADLPSGCFRRDYSADHLASHPNQHVAAIRLSFTQGDGALYPRFLAVAGRFADQGRAKLDRVVGQTFRQSAFCSADGGRVRCHVECDGGTLDIRSWTGDRLEVSTDYFVLEGGSGCEALSDLAELGGGATTYLLTRAPTDDCSGM